MPGHALKSVSMQAWNLLFPRRCVICGDTVEQLALADMCGECKKTLSINNGSACASCGMAIDGSLTEAGIIRCGHCRIKPPPLEITVFGLRYEGTARELIHLFKFSGRESLAGTVSQILCAQLHRKVEMDKINLIIPVPLHINRLFARGYNQSYLIAREVGRVFLLPVAAGILVRRLNTPSQRTLTRAKRLLNMKKAFTTRNAARLDGKRILLVDDIMTTGATMFAAARAIKKSGARSVVGCVAARA